MSFLCLWSYDTMLLKLCLAAKLSPDSHSLSKPFGIINPHGPGCLLFSYTPLSLPVISWDVKSLMVLSQYLLHHAGETE